MKRRASTSDATDGTVQARAYTAEFIVAKRRWLACVQAEKMTPAAAIVKAQKLHEKLHEKQLKVYLRLPGTTYQAWLDHGPRGELDELLEAARDPLVFENLVERYERREVSR